MTEKIAAARTSPLSSISRRSFRTWVRSNPFGARAVRFNSLTGLAGIGGNVALLNQPPEESPDRGQIPVDGRHGLISVPPKVRSEVGDVPRRHPADDEPLAVRCREPSGEFAKVENEPPP